MAGEVAIIEAFTPEDGKTFEKFFDGTIGSETHRFRLNALS